MRTADLSALGVSRFIGAYVIFRSFSVADTLCVRHPCLYMGIGKFPENSTKTCRSQLLFAGMLETSMGMEQHVQQSSQKTYVPAIVLPHATMKNSLQRLPIAVKGAIDHVCGAAQRVGYTGNSDDDLAIYRLKVKFGKNFSTITLPGFFVIEGGVFQNYEQWCRNHEGENSGKSK